MMVKLAIEITVDIIARLFGIFSIIKMFGCKLDRISVV